MIHFLLRRLTAALPVLFGVLLLTFSLSRLLPDDFAQRLAGEGASARLVEDLRWAHGLHRPLFFDTTALRAGQLGAVLETQFFLHCRRLFSLDFGRSWATQRPVSELLLEGLGTSLAITLPTMLGSACAALVLGLVAATLARTRWDRGLLAACTLNISIPGIALMLAAQYVLAYQWGWFPVHGWEGGRGLVMPVLLGILLGLGGDVRFCRAVVLKEMQEPHLRAARAKGIGPWRLSVQHALRPAVAPLLARWLPRLPFLLTGSLFLERVFGIPGLGGLMVEAIAARDYPVINAMTFLTATLHLLGQALTDAFSAKLDPRVRLS